MTRPEPLVPAGGMQPHDIGRLITVSSPALSPDGTTVAYVVTRVDLDANAYRSAVWIVPADGSARPRQLTAGLSRDSQPAWSPDGTTLAFTRQETGPAGPVFALCLVPVNTGGEIITIATCNESIEFPRWSPEGSRLAFAYRVRDARYSEPDEAARPPRRIDRLFPRRDGVGWTIDRPRQLFVVPADGGAPPRQMTAERGDCDGLTWAPDGRRIAFVAARHPDADLSMENDVWLLDVDVPGAEPQRLTDTDAVFLSPSFSPDGTRLAFLQRRGPNPGRVGHRHSRLAVLDLTTRKRRILTAKLDRNCTNAAGACPPVWWGSRLLVVVESEGRAPIVSVGLDSSVEYRDELPRQVTGVDARAGVVAYTAMSGERPTELFADTGSGDRQLTEHQRSFVASCPPIPAERFPVASADGETVDAWVMRPAAFDSRQRYPCLLNIHGGPWTQYGECWFDEFQLYASAGFVVLFSNPHGSTGYSENFARKILSPLSIEDPGTGWGGLDYSDLMTVVDTALARYPFIDPGRLGVMGGSYGGWATSWIVTHTDRFAAACSERAVNNQLSAEWSSDMAGIIVRETGVDPLDHPEELARVSPITYVRDISTPVLIIHSEQDLRCPVEQADALWVALRRLGKEVEYWRFPAEGHELSRSGSPRHRQQRAELIIDWFRRKL